MALLFVAAAFSLLATAAPLALPVAPAVVAKREEFLWRAGYWYCAHFAASERDAGPQHSDLRDAAKTLTVRRSEVAEDRILISARGTIAELPRLFALEIERQVPELRPVRVTDVHCYHFPSRRNLNAQIERQSGVGARRLVYRGKHHGTVTNVVTVPSFAPSAILALKRWRPSTGSTIYQDAPCGTSDANARSQMQRGATCHAPRR